jgi:hypothetical protein
MIKADRYYIDNLQSIHHRGSLDEDPRPKYSDGPPMKHTIFLKGSFQLQP